MDATKPYEFIGFGTMDATKPYEFIGFGAMNVTEKLPGKRTDTTGSSKDRKTHWKRWRAKPPTFSSWFCGRRGPFRHPK
jgi:hypothetical protein